LREAKRPPDLGLLAAKHPATPRNIIKSGLKEIMRIFEHFFALTVNQENPYTRSHPEQASQDPLG